MGTFLRRLQHRGLLWLRPLLVGIWISLPIDLWYFSTPSSGTKFRELLAFRNHLSLTHPVRGAGFLCSHQPIVEIEYRKYSVAGMEFFSISKISASIFDELFYEEQSPEAREHGEDLLSHFAKYGLFELRRPSPNVFHVAAEKDWSMRDASLESKRKYLHSENEYRKIVEETSRVAIRGKAERLLEKTQLNQPFEVTKVINFMEPSPVFSIIIPCFNQAEFLVDALKSVASATYQPHECIVIDDGNKDLQQIRILHSLTSFGPHQNVRLYSQANAGLAMARNAGLAKAQGSYVKFLDSDDALAPGSLDRQLEDLVLAKASANIGGYAVTDSTLTPTFTVDDPRKNFPLSIDQTIAHDLFIALWEQGLSVPIHSLLIRRETCPPFSPALRAKEDFMFWVSLARMRIRVTFSTGVIALYRKHSNQMTSGIVAAQGLYFIEALYLLDKDEPIDDTILDNKVSFISNQYGPLPIVVWAEVERNREIWLAQSDKRRALL